MSTEGWRYRCCCGCCRATAGAFLVGILDIITAAVLLWHGLAGKFVVFTEHYEYEAPLRQAALGGAGVFGTIGLLAVFAIICRLPCLLIFHMVVDIAALLGFGLLAALVSVIVFVASTEEQNSSSRRDDNLHVIIFLSGLGLNALLQIWYFLIMLSAYRSLSEDYTGSNTNGAYSMVPSNGSATANTTQPYPYYVTDGGADGNGMTTASPYTPMLATPNYYKQQPLYPASSPPMYG